MTYTYAYPIREFTQGSVHIDTNGMRKAVIGDESVPGTLKGSIKGFGDLMQTIMDEAYGMLADPLIWSDDNSVVWRKHFEQREFYVNHLRRCMDEYINLMSSVMDEYDRLAEEEYCKKWNGWDVPGVDDVPTNTL